MNTPDTHKLLREMAAESRELQAAAGGSLTDTVAGWLAGRYASAAHEKLAGAKDADRWEILRAFVQDWSLLRRGDHSAARLQLDREELDWLRANSEAEKQKQFWEWTNRPEILKKLCPHRRRGLTRKELKSIEDELNLL